MPTKRKIRRPSTRNGHNGIGLSNPSISECRTQEKENRANRSSTGRMMHDINYYMYNFIVLTFINSRDSPWIILLFFFILVFIIIMMLLIFTVSLFLMLLLWFLCVLLLLWLLRVMLLLWFLLPLSVALH